MNINLIFLNLETQKINHGIYPTSAIKKYYRKLTKELMIFINVHF